ncbi:unnamed protein product [Protopolystoma xenopodis]|uniref:Uncharacterized protein n=1 Tax=Protopolystoma xenopodis TaxID=117903 RepID=A0A448X826_9PLAT|nr:unnamed protein product [Protopolystoma xenopodis]
MICRMPLFCSQKSLNARLQLAEVLESISPERHSLLRTGPLPSVISPLSAGGATANYLIPGHYSTRKSPIFKDRDLHGNRDRETVLREREKDKDSREKERERDKDRDRDTVVLLTRDGLQSASRGLVLGVDSSNNEYTNPSFLLSSSPATLANGAISIGTYKAPSAWEIDYPPLFVA